MSKQVLLDLAHGIARQVRNDSDVLRLPESVAPLSDDPLFSLPAVAAR